MHVLSWWGGGGAGVGASGVRVLGAANGLQNKETWLYVVSLSESVTDKQTNKQTD
jgi:hypothetical protein